MAVFQRQLTNFGRIECTINRFKQFRRIATRYGKRAENYLALLTIVAILFWL